MAPSRALVARAQRSSHRRLRREPPRADRRGEQPGRIEHRSFLADRHEADDEIPFQGKLAHVAEQMRFARAETAPNEISLGLPTLVETSDRSARASRERN